MEHDQAYWDSQFKFSQILPDFADHLAQLEQSSEEFAAHTQLNRLAYGDDPRQWLETSGDLAASSRIFVFIHGGYWRALRAQDHRICLKGLLTLSPQVANLEYRLMPDTRMEGLVSDVIAGVHHLMTLLPNDANIVLVGHSAGAHLALSAANDPSIAKQLDGVVAISGLYDLAPVSYSFLQAELNLTQDEISQHSLSTFPDDVKGLCVVGDDETSTFKSQAEIFSDANGLQMTRISNTHHMSILQCLVQPNSPLLDTIKAWLSGQNITERSEWSPI